MFGAIIAFWNVYKFCFFKEQKVIPWLLVCKVNMPTEDRRGRQN
jgi:hypothetical protein